MRIKKVKELPAPRINSGSFTCNYDSISMIINRLMNEYKFTIQDLDRAHIDAEVNYDNCYYESDPPGVTVSVSWANIF